MRTGVTGAPARILHQQPAVSDTRSILVRRLVPTNGTDPDGLDDAKLELELVSSDELVASAHALCRRQMNPEVGALLRILLIDDRIARLPSALPPVLIDEWTDSVRHIPDRWPPTLLSRYCAWMSWHDDIRRRVQIAHLIPSLLHYVPAACIDALARLIDDAVPVVRAASEHALGRALADPASLVVSELIASWAQSPRARERLAICRALAGAPPAVGVPSALERLSRDPEALVRIAAVHTASSHFDEFPVRVEAILRRAVMDCSDAVRAAARGALAASGTADSSP